MIDTPHYRDNDKEITKVLLHAQGEIVHKFDKSGALHSARKYKERRGIKRSTTALVHNLHSVAVVAHKWRARIRNKYVYRVCQILLLLPLASRRVLRVGVVVEARTIGDLQICVIKTCVARYKGFLTILKSDRVGILELVVDDLGAVGLLQLDAFIAAGDGVVRENVVLRAPGVHHPRVVGPLVCVNVVPEGGNRIHVKNQDVVTETEEVSFMRWFPKKNTNTF